MRVDFNLPIAGGKVSDDFRLRAHMPTVKKLLRGGNKLVFLSHHSKRNQSLKPIVLRLTELLRKPVVFLRNPFGREISRKITESQHRVFLIENLRLWPGEEKCDLRFAENLARLGDIFVNDAFGAAHRRGASITVLPRLLKSFLGLLFEKELGQMDRVLENPKRPLVAIFGGAKAETKLRLVERFNRLADRVIAGGVIANSILGLRGVEVGRSEVWKGRGLKELAHSGKITLPVDAVVASSLKGRERRVSGIEKIKPNETILDIGPRSQKLFARAVMSAGTIVWNGPMGFFEEKPFQRGTLALAKDLSRRSADVLVGGGDTVAFLDKNKLIKKFKHVSTGGGAMLAYLAGQRLPALEALRAGRKVSFRRSIGRVEM